MRVSCHSALPSEMSMSDQVRRQQSSSAGAVVNSLREALVYHAHFRPLSTPLAAILDFSAQVHSKMSPSLPTPSSILRGLGLESVPNALSLPPIHVDHVGEAVCAALVNEEVKGVVGVRRMRELIGWANLGGSSTGSLTAH